MKALISLAALFSLSSAFAYSTSDTYSCLNNEEVTIRSVLSPSGERLKTADSSQFGQLNEVACEKIEQEWKSYGSENCFANKQGLFTHFKESGMLKFKVNGRFYFTICNLTNSVQ